MKLILEMRKTCSFKPDGHIKESHSQLFLANSACVGWFSLAAYLNMELVNSWFIVSLEGVNARPGQWQFTTDLVIHQQQKYVHKPDDGHGLAYFFVAGVAEGKGSCSWMKPLLTYRSWKGTDGWPTPPEWGNANYIIPITSWLLTQKQNTLHSYA